MTALLEHLESRRAEGRKLLVPYLMAGLPDASSFPGALDALLAQGDAVEVGIPYSDPLMDGPVIAAAGERALRAGVGPLRAVAMGAEPDSEVPRLVMTYYNPIHHLGEDRFCDLLSRSGYSGLIVPDLPVEESENLRSCAADRGLAWVPLVAPTSSARRVEAIVATATGFVYAVSTLGVTGHRDQLSERAGRVVAACREATDLPVCVGIGVSTPEQARAATAAADGVVIGSAVVQLILERGAEAAGSFLSSVRSALDGVASSS